LEFMFDLAFEFTFRNAGKALVELMDNLINL
jgi:hypothetical protein